MKLKIYIILLLAACTGGSMAQNVGIGTNEPYNKLHVVGNIVVTGTTVSTITAPTAAQTKTMINGTTTFFLESDSTGKIYDPGGPTGDYLPNLTSEIFIPDANTNEDIGVEIVIEAIQLGTGDSLFMKTGSGASYVLLAVGNNYTTTGKWVFNSTTLALLFKSNNDISTGTGFTISYKRLFENIENIPQPGGYSGNSLFFNVKTGAFSGGKHYAQPPGQYSTQLGYFNFATGNGSTALGSSSSATGSGSFVAGGFNAASESYAVALGAFNIASGNSSFAAGGSSTATGPSSFALGNNTFSSGFGSIALGRNTISSGNSSIAHGYFAFAQGDYSASIGYETRSLGYAGTVIGMNNNPILASPQTSFTPLTPLLIIGNGNSPATRSNAMVVLKNGNVGIGSDAPGFPLNFASTTGDKIALWGNTGNHYGFGIQGGLLQIHTDGAASDVAFGYGTSAAFTETMRIKGNGNVGIGTNAPSQKLHVIGNILATGTITPSDMRYKQNIQPLFNPIQKLQQLHGVTYNMNQQAFPEWQFDNSTQIGLIAQEVEKVFPELVKTIDPKNGYKGVDYVKLIPVLIEAVKEQQQQIEQQGEQITTLQQQLKNCVKQ